MAKLNRNALQQSDLSALVSSMNQQKAKGGTSPLTDEGTERGINVFRVGDHKNQVVLVYIPCMPQMFDVDGNPTKYHAKVITHGLNRLGAKDAYIGTIRSTKGLEGLEAWGISGTGGKLPDYQAKAWDYKNLRDIHDMLIDFGTDDRTKIDEDKAKNISKENFKYMPISNAEESFWFPIVVVETVPKKDGTPSLTPKLFEVLDEDGKPVTGKNDKGEIVTKKRYQGQLCWYKASQKTWEERLQKAIETVGASDFVGEGLFAKFDFRVKEQEEGKDNAGVNETMRSANSLSIEFLTDAAFLKRRDNAVKSGLIAKGGLTYNEDEDVNEFTIDEKTLGKWDIEARELYDAISLGFDVRQCQLLTDEDLNKELDKNYKDLDAHIARLQVECDKLRSGQTSTGAKVTSSMDSALESYREDTKALETTKEDDSAGVTVDEIEDDLEIE